MMQPALDLAPIQARWTAATPGEWIWHDQIAQVPYSKAWIGEGTAISGSDGTLGITGLFIEIFETGDLPYLEPILAVEAEDADEEQFKQRIA